MLLRGWASIALVLLGTRSIRASAERDSSSHHQTSTHKAPKPPSSSHKSSQHQPSTGNGSPEQHPLETGVISILKQHKTINSNVEHEVKTYLQHKSAASTLVSEIEGLIEHKTQLPLLVSAISSLFDHDAHPGGNPHSSIKQQSSTHKTSSSGKKTQSDHSTKSGQHDTRSHSTTGKKTSTKNQPPKTYTTKVPVTLTTKNSQGKRITRTETYKVKVTQPPGGTAIEEPVVIPLTNSAGSTYSTLKTKVRVHPPSHSSHASSSSKNHKSEVQVPVVVTVTEKNSQGSAVRKTETYKVQVTEPAGHSTVNEKATIHLTNDKGSVYSTIHTTLRIGPSGTIVHGSHSSHSSSSNKDHKTEMVPLPVVITTKNADGKKITKTETYKVKVTDPPRGHSTAKERVTVQLTNSAGSTYSAITTNIVVGPGGSIVKGEHSFSNSKKSHSSTRGRSSSSKKGSSSSHQHSSSTGKHRSSKKSSSTKRPQTTSKHGSSTGKSKHHSTDHSSSGTHTAGPGPRPSIITSTEVKNGHTELIPILAGGALTKPVTLPASHATITAKGPELTTSASHVSHDIVALIPLLHAWAKNPTPAQATALSNEVDGVIGVVGGLLGSLPHGGGGSSGGGSCGGLFGAIGCALGTAANGLATLGTDLVKQRVNAVVTAISAIQSAADAVEKATEDDQQSKSNDHSTKDHSTKESSTKSKSSSRSSTSSRSSSKSSCTSTSTTHSLDVRCTVVTSPSSSKTCITKTRTIRGCDLTHHSDHSTTTTKTGGCAVNTHLNQLASMEDKGGGPYTTIMGQQVPMWLFDGAAKGHGSMGGPPGSSSKHTGSQTTKKSSSTKHASSTRTSTGPTKTTGPSTKHKSTSTKQTTHAPKTTKPPSITNTHSFLYTSTDEGNGNIYGCNHIHESDYAGYAVTFCEGSSVKIGHTSPMFSMPPSSVISEDNASWSSLAAKPSGSCLQLADNGDGGLYLIYGINGWGGDHLQSLAQQESGCGFFDFEMWTGNDGFAKFHDRFRDTRYAFVELFGIKGGCVERAVNSAGGPSPGNGEFNIECRWPDDVPESALPLFQDKHWWTKSKEEPYQGYMFDPNTDFS